MLKFGSVFAGIGGFDLGFERAGMVCKWQVERDPFCQKVLSRHWPDVKRFDDVMTFQPKKKQRVDVICGGFPCQDLSVAGNRNGLSGKRSGLFFEMLRIVEEIRPRVLVWENVPGLFTSTDRRDFATVLRSLGDIGYFGAWRVLDAQFFGVPQRRRRVFGVFVDRRAGDWRIAAKILALTEGMCGNSQTGSETGKDIAGTLGGGSTDSRRGWRNDLDTNGAYIAATLRSRSAGVGGKIPGRGGEDDSNLVLARCLTTGEGARQDAETCNLIASTIQASQGHHGHSSPRGDGSDNLVIGTITGSTGGPTDTTPIVYQCQGTNVGESGTLRTGGTVSSGIPFILKRAGVRRLTPRECERCQGFPDDHTRYTAAGEEISDTQRYRMIGNAVVPNVANWIANRIVKFSQI